MNSTADLHIATSGAHETRGREAAAFVEAHPSAGIYHTPGYARLLESVLGCQTLYLTAHGPGPDHCGTMLAAMPLMLSAPGPFGRVANSLPFYGSHGGVLVHPEADDRQELLERLLRRAMDLCRESGHAALNVIEPLHCDHREAYARAMGTSPDSADPLAVRDRRISMVTPLPAATTATTGSGPTKDCSVSPMALAALAARGVDVPGTVGGNVNAPGGAPALETSGVSATGATVSGRPLSSSRPMRVDMDGQQAKTLLGSFSDPRPRNIRRALREGYGVSVEHGPDAMELLRGLHIQAMERIGGNAKPDAFFENLPRCLPQDRYAVYVARKDGQAAAALLMLFHGGVAEYFVPATDHRHMRGQPLSLLIFAAMQDAASRGMTAFNWGGTWATQGGVYDFKKRWGVHEDSYRYHVCVFDRDMLATAPEKLLADYPGFYCYPFHLLEKDG